MHSGEIPDNAYSITYLPIWPKSDKVRYKKETDGTRISFDVKISSQSTGDQLIFTMGGNYVQGWSGNVGWQRVFYDIPSGRPMIIQWEYRKDGGISEGSDSAWIRRVIVE